MHEIHRLLKDKAERNKTYDDLNAEWKQDMLDKLNLEKQNANQQ